MKYLLIHFISILLFITTVWAEDFNKYLQNEMRAFGYYKDTLDKEFSTYLKQPWKVVIPLVSKPEFSKPKVIDPTEILKDFAKKRAIKTPIIKHEVKISAIKPSIIVPTSIVTIPKPTITTKNVNAFKILINFYGNKLYIQYDNPLDNIFSTLITQKKIRLAWDKLATSKYLGLISQLQLTIKALNLNDWGQIKLLEKIGQKIFRNNNEIRLFTWFIFTKLRYDMRVGFTKKNIIILVPINTMVYNTNYFIINNKKYFAINLNNKKKKFFQVKTYKRPHANANLEFDLHINKRARLKEIKATRTLFFNFENKNYSVNVDYNKVYVAYYKEYPQIAFSNYFNAPISSLTSLSIHNNIAKLIEGKGEIQAINLLLRLVQKGFKYQIDEKQFNKEKVMLPEETLFYPYSDCEDRAILFAKLVRNLLGLEIVGVKFPQHLAIAVVLKSKLTGGTNFIHNGKRYYLADPTYIGANVGMMPSKYKNIKYEIIAIK